MTGVPLEVAPGEGGLIRLFGIDTGADAGAALRQALAAGTEGMGAKAAAALGVADIDPWWVTLVRVPDLGALGLAHLMAEGYDIPPDALAAAREDLRADKVHDDVLVVQSPAFAGRGATLAPAAYLHPIAAFDTKTRPAPARPMAPAEVAPKTGAAPQRPAPRRARKVPPGLVLACLAAAAVLIAVVALAGDVHGP